MKSEIVLSLMVFVSLVEAQNLINHDHHHKKHHCGHHHWHYLHYITFLAIKLKIIFFLGTIFTVTMVVGKIFAIIKFSEYMKKDHYVEHHEEKVVYVNPHQQHQDYGGYRGGAAADEYPPPDVGVHERFGQTPYHPQARSEEEEESWMDQVVESIKTFENHIKNSNVTEMALNEMGIDSASCRKRFMCSIQTQPIIRRGINIFQDSSYEKYQSNIENVKDCDKKYPNCSIN